MFYIPSSTANFTNCEVSSAAGVAMNVQGGYLGMSDSVVAGNGAPAALEFLASPIAHLSRMTLRSNAAYGIDLQNSSSLTLLDSTFSGNGGYAINGNSPGAAANIATATFINSGGVLRMHPQLDLTMTGPVSIVNSGVKGVDVQAGNIGASRTWRKLSIPYVLRSGEVRLNQFSAILSLEAGVIVKIKGETTATGGFGVLTSGIRWAS